MVGATGFAVAGYAAYAGMTWCRYGWAARADRDEMDPLLDQFMPEYEVAERHHVRVAAPAATTLAAAADTIEAHRGTSYQRLPPTTMCIRLSS
jgi:hypothetical protein